jgi:hypothetical protein
MKLFDILKIEMQSLLPEQCKIHLAGWNGRDDPMDIFLRGLFPEWQNWQSNRVFERPFIVSLIKMDNDQWLFAGVHSTHGCDEVDAQQDRPWDKSAGYSPTLESQKIKPAVRYHTKALPEFSELTGRLIVSYVREARNAYRNAETISEQLLVSELMPRPLDVEVFPGFTRVLLPKWKLDIIVKNEIVSWKAALGSVSGVYLITDALTGQHYIGSAYGEGGFWARWKTYSETGHGFNKILQALLIEKGVDYARNFQFAILETADSSAGKDQVLERESHWKNVLFSRESHGGYNAN